MTRASTDRTIEFAEALPRIRSRVDADLRGNGLRRERVLAAVIRLLDHTLVRVGNAEYARTNKSYGLTTLRPAHASINGDSIHLSFRGKGGKRVTADVRDRRVAAVMQRCTTLEGEELFQYVDENGDAHAVTSDDVNAYLRDAAGGDFSAKDFRTWAGAVIAASVLREVDTGPEQATREGLLQAVRLAAEQLGNTAAVCRRCYIHPGVLKAFSDGTLAKLPSPRAASGDERASAHGGKLRPEERAVLRLLKAAA